MTLTFVKAVPGGVALQAEAAALRAFGSHRAASLVEVSVTRGELVLERVTPGARLADIATEDQAMAVAAQLLANGGWPAASQASAAIEPLGVFALDRAPYSSSSPGGILHSGTTQSRRIRRDRSCSFAQEELSAPRVLRVRRSAGRPAGVNLLRAASLLRELEVDQRDTALLHGDLHYGNILSSDRAGYLLIDPKGAIGPPAFDVGYLVSRPMPLATDRLPLRRAIERRLEFLPDALGLDRRQVAAYAYVAAALSLAWAIEDGDDSCAAFAEAMRILEP